MKEATTHYQEAVKHLSLACAQEGWLPVVQRLLEWTFADRSSVAALLELDAWDDVWEDPERLLRIEQQLRTLADRLADTRTYRQTRLHQRRRSGEDGKHKR